MLESESGQIMAAESLVLETPPSFDQEVYKGNNLVPVLDNLVSGLNTEIWFTEGVNFDEWKDKQKESWENLRLEKGSETLSRHEIDYLLTGLLDAYDLSRYIAPAWSDNKLMINFEGTIAVGKTSAIKRLLNFYDFHVIQEDLVNPWLSASIENVDRSEEDQAQVRKETAFGAQLFYRVTKIKAMLETLAKLKQEEGLICMDRSYFVGDDVFINMHKENGNIDEREYGLLEDIKDLFDRYVPPKMFFFLEASPEELEWRKRQRGRDFEEGLDVDFLYWLQEETRQKIREYTDRTGDILIEIETSQLDEKSTSREISHEIEHIYNGA
ncbi:hypothetical protein GF362_04165 [Candidatus Dojkabacteria bacterium]|nr:hypothetical protein [Candidatus Dojkabacteria bacterium]